jgi:hypothetical protein
MIEIAKEPKNAVYTALLDFAATRCRTFSLVWRKQLNANESSRRMITMLIPNLTAQKTTDEWPGTRLIGHQAVVRYYSVTKRSLKILKEVKGLYSWLAPAFPEDLAFYASDSKCWLASISHEKQSWFEDEALTVEEILDSVPGLEIAQERLSPGSKHV